MSVDEEPVRKRMQISKSFARRMKTTFFLLDVNKDRIVTREELFDAHCQAYQDIGVPEIEVTDSVLFGWKRLVPSGRLTFDRFLTIHVRTFDDPEFRDEVCTVYSRLFKAIFDSIATGKDGKASLDDYEKYVRSYWVNPENANEISAQDFKAMDVEGTGYITFEQFYDWRCRYLLTDNESDPPDAWGWQISDEEWNSYYNSEQL